MNQKKPMQPQIISPLSKSLNQIHNINSTVIDPNTISELSSIVSDALSASDNKIEGSVDYNEPKREEEDAVQSRDPTINNMNVAKNVNKLTTSSAAADSNVNINISAMLPDQTNDKSLKLPHNHNDIISRWSRSSHRFNKSGATDNGDNDGLVDDNQLHSNEIVVGEEIQQRLNSSSSFGHRTDVAVVDQQLKPLRTPKDMVSIGKQQKPNIAPMRPINSEDPLSNKSDDVIARGQQFYCKMHTNQAANQHPYNYEKMFDEFKMSLTNFVALNQVC